MKFRIRYADQVVGLFIIIAILSLIFLIIMLGRAQRWFSKDYAFVSYASSASGLSKNMPVTYKGLAIGNVKSFTLTTDNRIEVFFAVHEEYRDRVTRGSLAEVAVNPLGLASQFIFYSGLGEALEEGGLVPMRDSPEGKEYIAQGIAYVPAQEDAITMLVSTAMGVFGDLRKILDELNLALGGDAGSVLGQALVNVKDITGNLSQTTGDLAQGTTIGSLEASLASLAGTLDNAEKATAYLPAEMPRITTLIADLRTTLLNADDVLVSLKNNPLLRKGIPDHAEIDSSGVNPRNISF
ncbi:MAG: MlaD family protein [Treponema sp.]|jgi:phospholipid/cholesterol/gamma-HCH transport system substrate-binding protein|nr:MlaD family protein [Treponema sp.]